MHATAVHVPTRFLSWAWLEKAFDGCYASLWLKRAADGYRDSVGQRITRERAEEPAREGPGQLAAPTALTGGDEAVEKAALRIAAKGPGGLSAVPATRPLGPRSRPSPTRRLRSGPAGLAGLRSPGRGPAPSPQRRAGPGPASRRAAPHGGREGGSLPRRRRGRDLGQVLPGPAAGPGLPREGEGKG